MNRSEFEWAQIEPVVALTEFARGFSAIAEQAGQMIAPALRLAREASKSMAETSYRLPTSLGFNNLSSAKMRDDLVAAQDELLAAESESDRQVYRRLIARITVRLSRLELLTSVAPIESARDLEPAWVSFMFERAERAHDVLRRVPLGCPPPRALVHAPGAPSVRVLV